MAARSQIVSVSVDRALLDRFDAWTEARRFPSRSSGLQHLIRQELDRERLTDEDVQAVATVTFVYDHHRRELMERLAHLQHEHLALVVSSTHAHLDHDRCLEVLILRGPARALRELGRRIVAIKGVERGELFLTAIQPDHAHDHDHAHPHEGPSWHAHAHGREPRPGTRAKLKAKARRR